MSEVFLLKIVILLVAFFVVALSIVVFCIVASRSNAYEKEVSDVEQEKYLKKMCNSRKEHKNENN